MIRYGNIAGAMGKAPFLALLRPHFFLIGQLAIIADEPILGF